MKNENYRIAMVTFLNGGNPKEYAFACFDDSLIVGEHVLCDTSNGYHVAKIVDFRAKEFYSGVPATKEIICRVDFTEFEDRKRIRKERNMLKAEMDRLVSQNQEMIIYQAIAEKNPEMAEMLEHYKKLCGM